MFCKKCGAQTSGNAELCDKCSGSQQQADITSLKKITPVFALILAVVSLIVAFILVLGFYDVTVNMLKDGDVIRSQSGQITELRIDDVAIPVFLGGMLFGFLLIAAAIVGIVFFVKRNKNADKEKKGFFVMGVLGTIGAIIHMLFCFFAIEEKGSFSYNADIPWFVWVLLVLFAGVAVLDKVVLNKKK